MTEAELEDRVRGLVARLDGAIKYRPMIADHPDWTDDEIIAFARPAHDLAMKRLKAGDPRWNEGIPYCRNNPAKLIGATYGR